MNIIIGLILGGGCVYLGFYYSKKYKVREQLLSELMQFTLNIQPKISFFQVPLPDIVNEQMQFFSQEFCLILQNVAKCYQNESTEEKYDLSKAVKSRYLQKSEQEYIFQLFSALGKSDSSSQMQLLKEYQEGLKRMHAKAYEEKNKFCSMYQKVGGLLGIAFFIVAL